MDYRDERDALRGRVDNLEQELGEARHKLSQESSAEQRARIARIEKQMADARRLLDGLGAELASLKGTPPRRPAVAAPIVAAVVLVFAGAGAAGFLVVRAPAPPPRPVVAVEAPAQPVQRALPAETPKPTAAPAPRRARATWTGKITGATGAAPAPGTACSVEATMEESKGSVDAAELTVSCGGKVLYRSTDPLEGMSMNGSHGEERAGAAQGTFTYGLAYDDKGARSGARNEVSLDTAAGLGSVWRTSVPAFHVDFSMAKQSAPVKGDALVR